MSPESLVHRLRKRAEIRRQITTRKSVQEGAPDRIADLLEEAAVAITDLVEMLKAAEWSADFCDAPACVCCMNAPWQKHSSECELAALLKRVEG